MRMGLSTTILGFAIVLAIAAQATYEDSFEGTTLGTPDQQELEQRQLRVLASPLVQQQRAESRKIYTADPLSKTPDGRDTLEASLDSIMNAMVQTAVNRDPERPMAFWSIAAAHSWSGRTIPNSGYGIENPDNVYRHIPMDGASRYEIHGQLPKHPPSQQSFTLYGKLPGMGKMDREGSPIIAALDNVATAPNGEFTVTIDSDPAGNRPNHLQSRTPTALLIVRDSLTDWTSETPTPLSVHRVGGPKVGPPNTEAEMARLAADLMKSAVPFWVRYNRDYLYSRPANAVLTPRTRGGGWGYATSGHFKLGEDEALVVHLDRIGARYLGFQLANPWGVGLEYVDRNGSLSAAQARANPDGTLTYVIAPKDPGVYNWLDTSGLHRGIFAIRWQGFAVPVENAEDAVLGTEVVPLSDLGASLPASVVKVNAAGRAKQIAERRASYERRLRE
jgi:hypothetical protein